MLIPDGPRISAIVSVIDDLGQWVTARSSTDATDSLSNSPGYGAPPLDGLAKPVQIPFSLQIEGDGNAQKIEKL
jgi:hypothetical protein